MRAAALLTVFLLAGCTGGEEVETIEISGWTLHGAFTESRTDADLEDLRQTAEPYSDDVLIMESFPEQFRVRGGDRPCGDLRALLLEKPYLRTVGDCLAEG